MSCQCYQYSCTRQIARITHNCQLEVSDTQSVRIRTDGISESSHRTQPTQASLWLLSQSVQSHVSLQGLHTVVTSDLVSMGSSGVHLRVPSANRDVVVSTSSPHHVGEFQFGLLSSCPGPLGPIVSGFAFLAACRLPLAIPTSVILAAPTGTHTLPLASARSPREPWVKLQIGPVHTALPPRRSRHD